MSRHVFPNHTGVIRAWVNGEVSHGRCGNLYFKTEPYDAIYSYGEHYPIARAISRADGNRCALVNSERYSTTTSCHVGRVIRHLRTWETVIRCPDPLTKHSHDENLQYFRDAARESWEHGMRARAYGEYHLEQYWCFVENCKKYCKIFHIHNPLRRVSSQAWNKAVGQARRRREQVLRKKRIKAEPGYWIPYYEEEGLPIEQRVERWRVRKLICNAHVRDVTALRLSEDRTKIETTHLASLDVKYAPLLWETIKQVRARGVDWTTDNNIMVGKYHLRKVFADGTLHIECHTIPFAESAYIARELGLPL